LVGVVRDEVGVRGEREAVRMVVRVFILGRRVWMMGVWVDLELMIGMESWKCREEWK
jgi:hypothetical protein